MIQGVRDTRTGRDSAHDRADARGPSKAWQAPPVTPAAPVLAVLGGGQLGRMLGLAATPLGLTTRFLDPSPTAGAAAVGVLVVGALDDDAAVDHAVAGADVVTVEWEGVPAATLARLAARDVVTRPGARVLAAAQDRLVEKRTFEAVGIPVPRHADVPDRDALGRAAEQVGLPAMLKTRRGGYDGKGQAVVWGAEGLDEAWRTLGPDAPLILEELVAFDREVSVIGARGPDGAIAVWPLIENHHEHGVLRTSRAPVAAVSDDTAVAARRHVAALMEHLDAVGVLAVEMFDCGGLLLANEMAPRVHNSGHWTIEGAVTSQFENHVRAVIGLPLGRTDARGHAVMVNLIGRVPDRAAVLAVPGAHLHLYGKSARPGRKVGHVTLVADTRDELRASEARLRAALPGDDG